MYATTDDMFRRYGRDTLSKICDEKIDRDEDGTPIQTVEEIIVFAISDASAAIDGYIDSRSVLPLSKIPAALVRLTCVIARYGLESVMAGEKIEKEYLEAIRYLEKVALGEISLALNSESERPEGGDIAIVESDGSVWNRKKSKGFI